MYNLLHFIFRTLIYLIKNTPNAETFKHVTEKEKTRTNTLININSDTISNRAWRKKVFQQNSKFLFSIICITNHATNPLNSNTCRKQRRKRNTFTHPNKSLNNGKIRHLNGIFRVKPLHNEPSIRKELQHNN